MERKQRRKFLIDPSFQIRFILNFCIIVVMTSLVIGGSVFLLTRNSTTVAIENTKVLAKPTSDFILPSLSMTVLIVSVFSALAVIVLALFVSHKISGPIFRLRREINLMQEGNMVRDFRIRNKDQLRTLAHSLSSMADTLRIKHIALRDSYSALVQYLKERDFCTTANDRKELDRMLKEIRDTLNYFKV